MMKNVETLENGTRLCHVLRTIMTLKCPFFLLGTFQLTELNVDIILLMLVWHRHPEQLSEPFI